MYGELTNQLLMYDIKLARQTNTYNKLHTVMARKSA